MTSIGQLEARDCFAGARLPRTRSATLGHSHVVTLSLSLLCPILLSTAFPTLNFGIVAFLALAPLFWLWSRISWSEAFWSGWLSGTLLYYLLFSWMAQTIFAFVGAWSIVFVFVVCAVEALAIAAVAVVASLVGRGRFRAISIFVVPAAWLIFESARSQAPLGLPFGELGNVGAHLVWFLPLAAYGSTYLLSAIVALANAAIAGVVWGDAATRRWCFVTLAVSLGLIAIAGFTRSHATFAAPYVRVAVAQGNIDQRIKWTPSTFARALATYADLTRQAARNGARVVVWPETAITSYPLQEPSLLHKLEALSVRSHAWILAGALDAPPPAQYYNAMIDLTPDGTVGGVYHKRWLMPFAEYLPLDRWLRRIPFMDGASDFAAGSGPHLLNAGGLRVGTLICYEAAFSSYDRATANAGADIMVMAADDAWFDRTKEPYEHADIAVIEAVSTGRWIVRSTQSGISEFVDPQGRIRARLGLNRRGVAMSYVGPGIQTPYDRHGAAWLFVLAFLTIAVGFSDMRRKAQG